MKTFKEFISEAYSNVKVAPDILLHKRGKDYKELLEEDNIPDTPALAQVMKKFGNTKGIGIALKPYAAYREATTAGFGSGLVGNFNKTLDKVLLTGKLNVVLGTSKPLYFTYENRGGKWDFQAYPFKSLEEEFGEKGLPKWLIRMDVQSLNKKLDKWLKDKEAVQANLDINS